MPSPKKRKSDAEEGRTFRLRITLRDVEPPVWRVVEVSGENTLAQLHEVIQAAMGWTHSHLHGFRVGKRQFSPNPGILGEGLEDAAETTVQECFPRKGSKIVYDYDFGDGWEHDVVAEAVTARDGAVRLPRCLGGARACPPEDCGGWSGYAELLEILDDPGHPLHDERLEWVGGDFDPEGFDAGATDQGLAEFRQEWSGSGRSGAAGQPGKAAAVAHPHEGRARHVIRGLFADVPVNDGELRRRLAGVPKDSLRAAAFEYLARGSVRPYQVTLLEAVFSELGLGAIEDDLEALVRNVEARAQSRACAFAVLMTHRTEKAAAIAEELGAEAMRPVFDEQMRALLAGISTGPGNAETVTVLVEGIPEETRSAFLATLDRSRRAQGFLSHSVFSDVVRNASDAAVRNWALERIAEERTTAARTLLQELRTGASTPEDRKAAQSAFLATGTAGDPGRRQRGQAWLGPCDGAGAFVVFAAIRNRDGTHAVANLCIRVSQGMRDGFDVNPVSRKEFDSLLAQYGNHGMLPLVRAPLGVAAGLARAGRDRTQADGKGIEPDALAALARLELVAPSEGPPLPAPCVPDADRLRSLFEKPYYDAWWFDAADLKQAGVPAGRDRTRNAKVFVEKAAAGLDRPQFRSRLDAMTLHMALWHTLRGEPAMAALMLGCRASVADDFRRSPLVLAMIERSQDRVGNALTAPPVGNPLLRAALRRDFLSDVEKPKGSDLAILDLTEAAALSLEAAIQTLPDEDHLRMDDQHRLAYAFATWFLVDLRRERRRKPAGYAAEISEFSGLAPVHAAEMSRCLQESVHDFILNTCAECPVRCLIDLDAAVDEPFFSSSHPAEAALAKQAAPGRSLAEIMEAYDLGESEPDESPRRKKPRRR